MPPDPSLILDGSQTRSSTRRSSRRIVVGFPSITPSFPNSRRCSERNTAPEWDCTRTEYYSVVVRTGQMEVRSTHFTSSFYGYAQAGCQSQERLAGCPQKGVTNAQSLRCSYLRVRRSMLSFSTFIFGGKMTKCGHDGRRIALQFAIDEAARLSPGCLCLRSTSTEYGVPCNISYYTEYTNTRTSTNTNLLRSAAECIYYV